MLSLFCLTENTTWQGNMTDFMCIVVLYSVCRIWCEQYLFIF